MLRVGLEPTILPARGTLGGIRTHTESILSACPLPIGIPRLISNYFLNVFLQHYQKRQDSYPPEYSCSLEALQPILHLKAPVYTLFRSIALVPRVGLEPTLYRF